MESEHTTLLALFDHEMREHARPDGPGVRVDRTGDVVRQVGTADDWNGAVWSAPDLDGARADAAIAAQVAYFTSLGHDEFERPCRPPSRSLRASSCGP